MLTRRQHELLSYICACVEATGVAPSYEAMAAALGSNSKGNIAYLIDALETRGFIRRARFRARAIDPLRRPDGTPFNAPGSAWETMLDAVHAVVHCGAPVTILAAPYKRCGHRPTGAATAGFPSPARERRSALPPPLPEPSGAPHPTPTAR